MLRQAGEVQISEGSSRVSDNEGLVRFDFRNGSWIEVLDSHRFDLEKCSLDFGINCLDVKIPSQVEFVGKTTCSLASGFTCQVANLSEF